MDRPTQQRFEKRFIAKIVGPEKPHTTSPHTDGQWLVEAAVQATSTFPPGSEHQVHHTANLLFVVGGQAVGVKKTIGW